MDEDKITQLEEGTAITQSGEGIAVTNVNDINVEDVGSADIEMDDAFPSISSDGSGETVNHALLNGRELSDQHPISAISGLRKELDSIEAVKRIYSSENGLGEFRKWNDENPEWTDRSGYFVKLVVGTENVDFCTNDDDVYGVSVMRSGFVGGQDATDKSDDPLYALVGITGTLRVRTDGTANIGDYVVPNELGVATKSENNCGYKVVSKGSYSTYEYITIAVTPQNDKINKIYGTMMDTEGSLGNLVLRIEEAETKVDDMSGKINVAINDRNELEALINENKQNIAIISNEAKGAQETANNAAESANNAVSAATSARDEALAAANEAKEQVTASLTDINGLKSKLEPLDTFRVDGEIGIQGLVNTVTKNSMDIATIQESGTGSGTDLTAITQQIKVVDEKTQRVEAAIQHLVVHSDKYSVGAESLSYGLSYEEAASLLKNGDTYVPTSNHTETMEKTTHGEDGTETIETINISFERGYVYTWDAANVEWIKGESVSTATTYSDGESIGDLWFCWQEVEYTDADGNITTFIPGTLYRWSEDNQWVAIATTGGNYKSRMISSIKQTADGIRLTVASLSGDVSVIDQKVDKISSRVANTEGDVSSIQQEVDQINLTVSSHEGSIASIQEDVTDNSARVTTVAAGQFSVVYQSLVGSPPSLVDGQHRYTSQPAWDDEQKKFVFSDELIDDTNGQYYYYINQDGTIDETKYYKVLPDGNYEVYIVGNQITSMFENYVTDDEALARMVADKVDEKTAGMTETIATVETKANNNEAKITQVANYYYHKLLYVSEAAVPIPDGELRYSSPPEWDASQGRYVFNASDVSEDGAYYIADTDGTSYCCVKTAGDGSTVYEVYGLLANYIASIETGADEKGGYIQSMVLDVERYSVSQYSPSYGMSYDDAVGTVPKGTTYVPTVSHSENLIPDEIVGTDEINAETLSAGTLEERESDNQVVRLSSPTFEALDTTEMQTYDFDTEYSYEWDGKGWVKGQSVAFQGEYCFYDGTTDLWYCTADVVDPIVSSSEQEPITYKAGTLYKWQGNCWCAIATVNDSLLSRSISLVRQTANSYAVELRNTQGDFSQYKQTVNKIGMLVYGSDGSSGEFNITTDGIVGEVYNRTGNSATLKAQADSTQAVLDLMISGVYHKLEQPLTSNVPEPYGTWGKYSARPEWSVSFGKFVFDTNSESEDGIYYFFDDDETHYCKVVGDKYEVYTIGTLSTAGTDAHITEEYANINTLAYYGDDEISTIAGLRNLALEGKAQIQILASLDKNTLDRVVNMYGYTVPDGTKRYASKPTYLNGSFTFDGQVEDENGEYFFINSQQFGKLNMGAQGSCYGYEVYKYDSSSTSGLVSTVLENQASVGMIVDSNGVKGSVVVEAINNQSSATISADKVNLNGYVTVNSLKSGGSTVIDGSRITTGAIDSSNYTYNSGNFSTSGTEFDLSDGSITSKNFAIDSDGNVYLRKNINIGLNADGGYNFTVDSSGNVNVAGTLDAKVLKFNGKPVLTSDNKVSAQYLELKGITITDNDGKVTFKVDSNGNVTVQGNIIMGSGSSISWSSITGVPTTVTNAYNLADSAYDRADVAYNKASDAQTAADNASNTVSGWKYGSTTYIDGAMIKTGTVIASQLLGGAVGLLNSREKEIGKINITGADTSDFAIELYSDGALRLLANYGSVYLWNGRYSTAIHLGDLAYFDASVAPANDNSFSLGVSDRRWTQVYAIKGTINTSDRREKKDIEYNMDKYSDFFLDLKPTQYKFVHNNSNRYHIGFISQDIEESLNKHGLLSTDFAGFIKSPVRDEKDASIINDYKYGLRYSEFIALNTYMIQKLYTKIDELESKIKQLEGNSTGME